MPSLNTFQQSAQNIHFQWQISLQLVLHSERYNAANYGLQNKTKYLTMVFPSIQT